MLEVHVLPFQTESLTASDSCREEEPQQRRETRLVLFCQGKELRSLFPRPGVHHPNLVRHAPIHALHQLTQPRRRVPVDQPVPDREVQDPPDNGEAVQDRGWGQLSVEFDAPGGPALAHAAAIDSAGNIVAAGLTQRVDGDRGFLVAKVLGFDGSVAWTAEIDGTTLGDDTAFAVAIDGNDDIVADGQTFDDRAENPEAYPLCHTALAAV